MAVEPSAFQEPAKDQAIDPRVFKINNDKSRKSKSVIVRPVLIRILFPGVMDSNRFPLRSAYTW